MMRQGGAARAQKQQQRSKQSSPQNDRTYVSDDYSSQSSSQEAGDAEYSSNEQLLLIAFVSFMSFSSTQLYFAFRAESEAMKGDSAAMIVDSLTYLFNWIAERRKHTFDRYYKDPPGLDPERAAKIRQRTKRKVILQLEILPPLVSVAILLVVTGVVFRDAAKVIMLDLHRDAGEQSDPNIDLMMIFSLINLGLDGINFYCFAQASHLYGFLTTEESQSKTTVHAASDGGEFSSPYSSNGNGNTSSNRLDHWMDDNYDESEDQQQQNHHHHHHEHANLNMVRMNIPAERILFDIIAFSLTTHLTTQTQHTTTKPNGTVLGLHPRVCRHASECGRDYCGSLGRII